MTSDISKQTTNGLSNAKVGAKLNLTQRWRVGRPTLLRCRLLNATARKSIAQTKKWAGLRSNLKKLTVHRYKEKQMCVNIHIIYIYEQPSITTVSRSGWKEPKNTEHVKHNGFGWSGCVWEFFHRWGKKERQKTTKTYSYKLCWKENFCLPVTKNSISVDHRPQAIDFSHSDPLFRSRCWQIARSSHCQEWTKIQKNSEPVKHVKAPEEHSV